MEITQREPVDIAWQRNTVYRRMRRLVAFDMDSTLINHEVIDELAKEAGVGEQVAKITESRHRGELDFDESLIRRVGLLKGLDESVLARVADRLQLNEGAEVLVSALKKFGFKTAVLSGGFLYFGWMLQRRLGIDHIHANDLEISGGKLTGRVKGRIVNAQGKVNLLKEIAARENISLQQTIAVGDERERFADARRRGIRDRVSRQAAGCSFSAIQNQPTGAGWNPLSHWCARSGSARLG